MNTYVCYMVFLPKGTNYRLLSVRKWAISRVSQRACLGVGNVRQGYGWYAEERTNYSSIEHVATIYLPATSSIRVFYCGNCVLRTGRL